MKGSISNLTPGQAHYILGRLAAERKVSAADINRLIAEMQTEIRTLEARIALLKQVAEESGAAPARGRRRGRRGAAAKAAPAARAAAPKKPVTKEVAATRKLQGQYLSLLRQLPKEKRAPFQTLARNGQRDEAVKKMRAFLKK